MENIEKNFMTQKGYDMKNAGQVTSAMEDYLEMICRYTKKDGFIRISTLADNLHVKASSASKMVSNLRHAGLVDNEKYGFVRPTLKGMQLGNFLLYRHSLLNHFFCIINHSEDELELTEQIEHYIKKDTVKNIENVISFLEEKGFH